MVHPRSRRGQRNPDSPDPSSESAASGLLTPSTNYTRRTADTSSLTGSETSQLHLPKLPAEDELIILRRRLEAHERREGKLNKDIVRIKKELDFAKENTTRLQQAVHGDVRPGAHYRKEIFRLKQELNQKDDIIQERDITIDNLMAWNHPNHLFLVEHPDSLETSVCSSLLEDVAESPPAREMERLLLENSTYIHRLRERDEEVKKLRVKVTQLEQDRIYMKQNEISRTKGRPRTVIQVDERRKESSDLSSVAFDPFQLMDNQAPGASQLKSTDSPSQHSDSVRMTKRVMELHNELGKRTKEIDSMRYKLQQSENEIKRLRTERSSTGTTLHSEKIKNMSTELSKSKLALHDAELRSKDYATALNHHKDMISDLRDELKKRDSIIFDLTMKENYVEDLSHQQDEIGELRKALSESLVELENATQAMTEQRQTIDALKKESNAKEKDYLQVQRFLRVETDNLDDAQKELLKKESKIKELSISKSENDRKMSNEIEHLKDVVLARDRKIKCLQQNLVMSEENNQNLKKLIENEAKVGEMKLSRRIGESTLDVPKHRLELGDSGADLQESLKRENEDLTEKMHLQHIQLHNTDRILLEKEQEKGRLKSSLERLRSKLGIFEAEKFALEMKITKEKEAIISDLEAVRDELESALKDKTTDHDKMMQDIKLLKRHIKESGCETNCFLEQVAAKTKIIDSQFDRIKNLEQQLVETPGKGIDVGDSKIELRARRDNHSVGEPELDEMEGGYVERKKRKSDESKSLTNNLESTCDTLNQMNIHITEKNCIIARLLNSLEESRQSLYDARARHWHLQEQLILKDEQIIELQAAKNLENNVLRVPMADQIDLYEEKIEHLLKEKEDLAKSLTAVQDALNTKAKTISNLENHIETTNAKMKDKRYEKDTLLKKCSQLGERNEIIEQKIEILRSNATVFADEILQLQEEIVRKHCGVEPFKKYLKMLLDVNSDTMATKTLIHGLKRARVEFVNELNSLFAKTKELHKREKELVEKTNDIANPKRTVEEVKKDSRRNPSTESKLIQDILDNMDGKDEYLETNKITMQALSLEKLIADLQKEIKRSKELMAENSVLKKQNACITELFDELSIEVQDLSKKLANLATANEDIHSLKNELEAVKKSENEKVTSYERQISALTMNKDVTIDTLRKDLAASRSRSAEEVARLTNEMSKLRELSASNEDKMRMRGERIRELEGTLHAQEKIVESLGSELGQVQVSMRNVSEQRKRELEELQRELIESKSQAMNQDREYTNLKVKLDECKIEHEREIKSLGEEIERLNKDSALSKTVRELQGNNMMLEAKQRLEQLKVVNTELKEDNFELAARLERAIAKIQCLEEETQIAAEMEREYMNVREQLKDLEYLLEENARNENQRSQANVKNSKSQNVPKRFHSKVKGRGTGEGSKSKLLGWGKRKVPSVLVIDTNETPVEESE